MSEFLVPSKAWMVFITLSWPLQLFICVDVWCKFLLKSCFCRDFIQDMKRMEIPVVERKLHPTSFILSLILIFFSWQNFRWRKKIPLFHSIPCLLLFESCRQVLFGSPSLVSNSIFYPSVIFFSCFIFIRSISLSQTGAGIFRRVVLVSITQDSCYVFIIDTCSTRNFLQELLSLGVKGSLGYTTLSSKTGEGVSSSSKFSQNQMSFPVFLLFLQFFTRKLRFPFSYLILSHSFSSLLLSLPFSRQECVMGICGEGRSICWHFISWWWSHVIQLQQGQQVCCIIYKCDMRVGEMRGVEERYDHSP